MHSWKIYVQNYPKENIYIFIERGIIAFTISKLLLYFYNLETCAYDRDGATVAATRRERERYIKEKEKKLPQLFPRSLLSFQS